MLKMLHKMLFDDPFINICRKYGEVFTEEDDEALLEYGGLYMIYELYYIILKRFVKEGTYEC